MENCIRDAVKFEADIDFARIRENVILPVVGNLNNRLSESKPERFRLLIGDDIIIDYLHKSPFHHQLFWKTCGIRLLQKLDKPEIGIVLVNVTVSR
jgi:hypothetical protein